MSIRKAASGIDVYRFRADAKNVNWLTGRGDNASGTDHVAQSIVDLFVLASGTVFVDVGCGDGTTLRKAAIQGVDPISGRLIGILPSLEECVRVRNHLAESFENEISTIQILNANMEDTKLASNSVDILVVNSVLHLAGNTSGMVERALAEFHRILKSAPAARESSDSSRGIVPINSMPQGSPVEGSGWLFIGEMPYEDELLNKNYGDSILHWLFYLLREKGVRALMGGAVEVLWGLLSKNHFIIAPKQMFYMNQVDFCGLLRDKGFEVIYHWDYFEMQADGVSKKPTSRVNYLARKFQ